MYVTLEGGGNLEQNTRLTLNIVHHVDLTHVFDRKVVVVSGLGVKV